MTKTPQRPATKAIAIPAIAAPCRSFIVVLTRRSPGTVNIRGVASVSAMLRVTT
jgi:hypothetical protein